MVRVWFILMVFFLAVASGFLAYDLYKRTFSIQASYRNTEKTTQSASLESEGPSKRTELREVQMVQEPSIQVADREADREIVENRGETEDTEIVLSNIQDELADLPDDLNSAPARSMLLQTASNLPMTADEAEVVHEMAVNELFQPLKKAETETSAQSPNQSFGYFLPVLAHEIALKTTDDLGEALGVTLDGVMVHRDPSVRYSLVRQFLYRYPEFEYDLQTEFLRNNIGLEYFDQSEVP